MVLVQPDQVGGFMGRGTREQFIEEDDFTWGGNAGTGVAAIAVNTVFSKGWRGSFANNGTLSFVTTGQSTTVQGVLQLETVTSTNAIAAYARFASSTPNRIIGAGQRWHERIKVNIVTLSTAGDRFADRHGLINSLAAAPTDGVYFEYSDNLSGGNWRGVAMKASVPTLTSGGTSIPVVAGSFVELEIRHNGTGVAWNGVPAQTTRFLVNGVSIGDVALAALPTNAIAEGGSKIRSAGTAQRLTLVDYHDVDFRWDPPRAA